jgi:hypothetical protein
LKKKEFSNAKIEKLKAKIQSQFNISKEESNYFLYHGTTSNQAYNYDYQQIMILYKNGKTREISQISDQLNLKSLAQPVVKFYICYPKEII